MWKENLALVFLHLFLFIYFLTLLIDCLSTKKKKSDWHQLEQTPKRTFLSNYFVKRRVLPGPIAF